jgi:hypothetical protein
VSPLLSAFVVCVEDGHFDVRPFDPFLTIPCPNRIPSAWSVSRGRCYHSGATTPENQDSDILSQ